MAVLQLSTQQQAGPQHRHECNGPMEKNKRERELVQVLPRSSHCCMYYLPGKVGIVHDTLVDFLSYVQDSNGFQIDVSHIDPNFFE